MTGPAAILIGAAMISAAVLAAGVAGPLLAPYRLAVVEQRPYRLNIITGNAERCEYEIDARDAPARAGCRLVWPIWTDDPPRKPASKPGTGG